MYVDVHAHYNDPKFPEYPDEYVEKYRAAGVGLVVNAGFDLESTKRAEKLAERYEDMYFTAGIHPDDARTLDDRTFDELKDIAKSEKCVAIGEIGFDFYWNKSAEEEQYSAFERQAELAAKLGKPFVVHSRNAAEKTFRFLSERRELLGNGFMLHCFSESAEMARRFKELGAIFSLGGVITFKNAKKAEVVKEIGIDYLTTETDCPYLSPEPYRGEQNDSSRIPLILEKMAEFLQTDEKTAQNIIENNARKFYRI